MYLIQRYQEERDTLNATIDQTLDEITKLIGGEIE